MRKKRLLEQRKDKETRSQTKFREIKGEGWNTFVKFNALVARKKKRKRKEGNRRKIRKIRNTRSEVTIDARGRVWISSNRNWSITNGKRRVTNREISISPGTAVSDFHAGVPKRQSAVGFAISAWLQTPFAVIRNGSPRDIAIMTLLNKLVGRHARLYTAFNSIPVVHVSRIRYYVNSLPFHVLWELINFWHGRRIVRWLWCTRLPHKEEFSLCG